MKSKENDMLELFFDNPTKEWHFEEILKEAKIARSKATGWLKQFIKEGIIHKVKEKGKMPYYMSDHNSAGYQNKKRIFALNRLYESGLLNHLAGLKKAKAVILFGSFSRWDWYKGSDIDIFIYGSPQGLSIAKYELVLHRDIQLFICENKKDLKKLGPGLVKNIVKGNLLKGDLDFVKVDANA
jgi:predicted nucleotidyltransferase